MVTDPKKPWWEPALELFSKVSGWIVAPIVFSLFVGKYLDNKFHTAPYIFLGLTGFSFLITFYGIVRVVREYMKKIDEESKNNGK